MIPLALAYLCLDCTFIGDNGARCLRCSSGQLASLAKFTDRERGRACRSCGRELVRATSERLEVFAKRKSCNRQCRDAWRHMMARSIWTLTKRFWSNVEKGADCWLWKGNVADTGYGTIGFLRHTWHVHRLSAVLAGMYVPPGHDLCHSCDVRRCVRPDHLFVGERIDNVQDAVSKRRHTFGEDHWNVKITAAQALEIRQRYATGTITQRTLGREYGLSHSHISGIVNGRFWAYAAESFPDLGPTEPVS